MIGINPRFAANDPPDCAPEIGQVLLSLYRFCLKIQGSAQPADRFRGSFSLPGARQNRVGAVSHYKT